MKNKSVEMTDIFSEEGLAKLSKGQTLTFQTDNGKKSYKIMKIKDGRIWVKEIKLYLPEEIDIIDKKEKLWRDKVTNK